MRELLIELIENIEDEEVIAYIYGLLSELLR